MNEAVVAVIILVVGVGLVFGGVLLFGSKDEAPATTTTQQEQDGITEPEIVTFTSAEVATRSTAADCWTIIGGSVYDITNYIPIHPGGNEILRACGADGTSLFTSRTTEGGEPVGTGTPHSSNANSQLGQYFVGNLEN